MEITEVIVSAGRKFNHPYESYSNLNSNVTLKAALKDGDDYKQCVADLQTEAETIAENHKQKILVDLEMLERTQRLSNELLALEEQAERITEKIGQIKNAQKQLPL